MMLSSLKEAVAQFQAYAREAGHSGATAMCSYFTALVDTPQEQRAARERLLFYLQAITPAFPGDRDKAPPHIRYFVDIVERILAMRPEDLGERSIVTGTREQVIEHFKRIEASGIEE